MIKTFRSNYNFDALINYFINIFSIFSIIFIFIQFERYEGSSEKWDILLFTLLCVFAVILIFFIKNKKDIFFEVNNFLTIVLVYSIIKGISVFEYRDFGIFEFSSNYYVWLGFGFPVLFAALILSPLFLKIFFDKTKFYRLIRAGLFVYLIISFLLTYFQQTSSLIDTLHSSYIFDELLALKVGNVPYDNFIPQYQTIYTFFGYLIPNLELNELINTFLYMFYFFYILIAFIFIYLIRGSSKEYTYINSSILFLPFLLVSPIFYNRIGSGGTIPSLLSNYPIRLFPYILIFLILMKGYSFNNREILITKRKYVLFAFYLSGLNIVNNFEFGFATIVSLISLVLLIDFVKLNKINIQNLIYSLLSIFTGFLTIWALYSLSGNMFNIKYLGYFTFNFVSSNALGVKIDIPGPSLFLVPLIFTIFITHIRILNNTDKEVSNYALVQRNSFIGLGFGLFSIIGLPYYINTSYAAGQLQFFLILVSFNFSLLFGSLTSIENFKYKFQNSKLNLNKWTFLLTASIFITSSLISASPTREFQRITNNTYGQSWPDNGLSQVLDEVLIIQSLNSEKTSYGFLGSYSRIVSYETGLYPLAIVSGAENIRRSSNYIFQNDLYQKTCSSIISKNLDMIIIDLTAYEAFDLAKGDKLCGTYSFQNNPNLEATLIYEK